MMCSIFYIPGMKIVFVVFQLGQIPDIGLVEVADIVKQDRPDDAHDFLIGKTAILFQKLGNTIGDSLPMTNQQIVDMVERTNGNFEKIFVG